MALSTCLSLGATVRVVDAVCNRYFPESEAAKRGGWTGRVSELCCRPFEAYVRVDFELRPRQRRQRLKEFMPVLDLELISVDEDGSVTIIGPAKIQVRATVDELLAMRPDDVSLAGIEMALNALDDGDKKAAALHLKEVASGGQTQWHKDCGSIARLFKEGVDGYATAATESPEPAPTGQIEAPTFFCVPA
ncbi:hypothetical protein [Burkholderia sp. Ac-20365]|uniref:hypothetical protein n=1 Tax=Burkholderia sp. Ac-20365 TaxID=2703897 RepID=UPI00197BD7D5|nr:hypothetical protein [Burkholderia sp. Ac-20365]